MIKLNPFTGNFDLVGAPSSTSPLPISSKLDYAIAALAAYDRIAAISFDGEGTIYRRISEVTITSNDFPDADVDMSVTYLDVGTMDQRINEIAFSGAVFGSEVLKKIYQYNQNGIRHEMAGFQYELA